MCGIVGYIGKQNATEILLDALRRLEYRGYDSAGLAVLNGENVAYHRAEGKLINLEREVLRESPSGMIGIGHTRWATHGRPVLKNAHPQRVGPIMVVHNGIVENYAQLKQRLGRRKSARFKSETDTEVIAHLVYEYAKEGSSMLAAMKQTVKELKGTFALSLLHQSDHDHIYFAKKGSPLVIGVGDGEFYLASDIPALLPYTRNVLFLEDGDYGAISRSGAQIYNKQGRRVKRPVKRVSWDQAMAEKAGYRHFMLKEIYEQPAAILQTLAGRIEGEKEGITLEGIKALMPGRAFPFERVYLVACGTSYHAAMVGKYLMEQMARVPVFVDQASEFRYRNPILDKKTLLLTISQSGETADTLAAIESAKKVKARILSICNVVDSSIPRKSDLTLYTHAGPEIGVASTKAFITQLILLVLLALDWGRRFGGIKKSFLQQAIKDLSRLADNVQHVLNLDKEIEELARRYTDVKTFLYFGRGIHYPIALEGALKLKEISYIHAEGYAAGEMKHGPIALIDRGTPVLVLAQRDGVIYEKTLSNVEEVRARGADVITVATRGDKRVGGLSSHCLYLPRVPWFIQPILETVPLQLLAYHIADLKGTDVDQPRNLAKSVTVE